METSIAEIPKDTLDEAIALMATKTMGEVVRVADDSRYIIATPCNEVSARWFLVSRLYSDAIFNNDIRAISLIINRIDGGLPKDTEVAYFATDFGDCLNEVGQLSDREQFLVTPEDTVMTALCKALYKTATEDIYWDAEKGRKVKPSDTRKAQRDQAMRLILERSGGRKTKIAVEQVREQAELNDWVIKALQGGEDIGD